MQNDKPTNEWIMRWSYDENTLCLIGANFKIYMLEGELFGAHNGDEATWFRIIQGKWPIKTRGKIRKWRPTLQMYNINEIVKCFTKKKQPISEIIKYY